MFYFLKFILFLSLLSCASQKNASTNKKVNPAETELNVLFIGNSLTYNNDLPLLTSKIAEQDNVRLSYKSICLANYSLEDHWNDGGIQKEIREGACKFVVVQQGPSAAPESQKLLVEYVSRIKTLCTQYNKSLVVYMVWPQKTRIHDLDNVISSYTNAATLTGSILAPAGLAWKYAWQHDAELPLYSPDDFHPSVQGSLLAGLVIYAAISQKKDMEFLHYEAPIWKNNISENQFEIFKKSGNKALGN
jgi:hypothetical protein